MGLATARISESKLREKGKVICVAMALLGSVVGNRASGGFSQGCCRWCFSVARGWATSDCRRDSGLRCWTSRGERAEAKAVDDGAAMQTH